MPDSTADLIAAGQLLATLAEPKDELSLGADFREIAVALEVASKDLRRAYELAEQTYFARLDRADREPDWIHLSLGHMTRDDIHAARADELRRARAEASRKAKQALVDLARLVGELETAPGGEDAQ